MKKDSDSNLTLQKLYQLDAVTVAKSRVKRLKKYRKKKFSASFEAVFFMLYESSRETDANSAYKAHTKKYFIGHNTVKRYASDWFNIIEGITSNKVCFTTFRSTIDDFFSAPLNEKCLVGILNRKVSIIVSLCPECRNKIKEIEEIEEIN